MLLIVTLLAAGTLAASAQQANVPERSPFLVRTEALLGFGGAFKAGRWNPVSLTVQNLGPDIRGTLAVDVARGDRFGPNRLSTSHVRPLDLVSGATKEFQFVLPLETAVYPLSVTVTHNGREVWNGSVELAGSSVRGTFGVVVSRRTSLDFLLPAFNSPTRDALELVYPLPEYLPAEWQGYDAVDLLVLHDGRLSDLTPGQVKAMGNWVAAGGRLVISAGPHWSRADADALAPIVDLRSEATDVVQAGDTGFAEAGLPLIPGESGQPVVVSRFAQGGATIRSEQIGRGDVIILPFDFAQFVRVAPVSSLGLWAALTRTSLSEPDAAPLADDDLGFSPDADAGLIPISERRRVFEHDLLANQLDLPVYDFPRTALVAAVAAVYLLLIALLLFWMTRHRTDRPTRAGIPLLVILAAAMAVGSYWYLTVQRQPREALAFAMEIAEFGPADGHALVTRDIALFSRTRADYTLVVRGTPAAIPLQDRSLTVQSEAGSRQLVLPVDRWGYENALLMDIEDLSVSSRIQRGVGYVNIELQNEGENRLRNLVALRDGFPRRIGDLPPGETVEEVIMGSGAGKWEEIEWQGLVPADALSEHRARLLEDLARRQRFTIQDGITPDILVVGWRDAAYLEVEITPSFDRYIQLNAVVLRIPAAGSHENGRPEDGGGA
jgi:hypothetical protein